MKVNLERLILFVRVCSEQVKDDCDRERGATNERHEHMPIIKPTN